MPKKRYTPEEIVGKLRQVDVLLFAGPENIADIQVRYDRIGRRIEISAMVSEAVAKAFEKTRDLPEEVSRSLLGT